MREIGVELVGDRVRGCVFQAASGLVRLLIVKAELLHQENFPQAVAAHDIVGMALALLCEIDAFVGAIDDQPLILELAAHIVDRDGGDGKRFRQVRERHRRFFRLAQPDNVYQIVLDTLA
jgi:hypothetical protein